MLQLTNDDGEFVFVRRSALQVKTGTLRVGDDIDGTTDRITLPSGAQLIELTCTTDCYIRFGDSSVDATTTIGDDDTASKLFMAGVQIIEVPSPGGTLAVALAYIQVAAAGFIQAEKLV